MNFECGAGMNCHSPVGLPSG